MTFMRNFEATSLDLVHLLKPFPAKSATRCALEAAAKKKILRMSEGCRFSCETIEVSQEDLGLSRLFKTRDVCDLESLRADTLQRLGGGRTLYLLRHEEMLHFCNKYAEDFVGRRVYFPVQGPLPGLMLYRFSVNDVREPLLEQLSPARKGLWSRSEFPCPARGEQFEVTNAGQSFSFVYGLGSMGVVGRA